MSEHSPTVPTFILTPDDLIPTPYRVTSLAEAVSYEPQGVYTVSRTFHGDRALLLDAHLDRLEQSAHLMDIVLYLDRPRLREALRGLLHRAGYSDAKFRITIPADAPDCVYLSLERFAPVPEAYQRQGVSVMTVPLVRSNPVVKTTTWMSVRRPTYDRLPPGIYEGILTGAEGTLLEGMSSNFYGVLNGRLCTAEHGILEGITRRALLEVAPEVIPVAYTALHKTDIPHLSEAMLSSSGRGVVPIVAINEHPVGKGQVGPIVSQIRARFDAWTEENLEAI